MHCTRPLQAFYTVRSDGKKKIQFSNALSQAFRQGRETLGGNEISIPCGRCMDCRLEKSRQWALRCVHEASLYEDNCFVTLTFDDESISKQCPTGSLNKKHMQDFIKRLRTKFSDRKIRVFYCGEYGDLNQRPHYHILLFNLDFPDKVYLKTINGEKLFTSDILSKLWPYGISSVGSLTFESAAYVARYCTKKVTGSEAEDHYKGRLPEFAQASLKPGLGKGWFEKFGYSDVFPLDECVVRGSKCKPPRYYDRCLERDNPVMYQKVKDRRMEKGEAKADDNTFSRLKAKEKCTAARMRRLVRSLESGMYE